MEHSEFARIVHINDRYKGLSYMNHLYDVALSVEHRLKPLAFLHDSISMHQDSKQHIELLFGDPQLLDNVIMINRKPEESDKDYMVRLLQSPLDILDVKIAELESLSNNGLASMFEVKLMHLLIEKRSKTLEDL